MYDRFFHPAKRFERHPDKGKLRFGSGGKSHFDFLESDFRQHTEKLDFRVQIHRLRQSLIAVPKIYAAPSGRADESVLFHPIKTDLFGQKILLGILLIVFHRKPPLTASFFRAHNGGAFN